MPKRSGFTLIELLVVITIIGVLSAIGLLSYQLVLKQGRDAKRQSDLKVIQSGLEQYRGDNPFYPSQITSLGTLTSNTGRPLPSPAPLPKIYLNTIPSDPLTSPQYCYKALPDGCNNDSTKCTSYELYTLLEIPKSSETFTCSSESYNMKVTSP